MQKDLQVPSAKSLLDHQQFSKLYQTDTQNIMGNVGLEYLVDIVFDGLGVQVLVEGLFRRGLVLELTHENRLEYNDSLGSNLPPRVHYQFLQNRQLLSHHLATDHYHIGEQLRNNFSSIDSGRGWAVMYGLKPMIEELTP